jgi:rubrerythrin
MTREDSTLLMVLIVFVLLFLLFGGLGTWSYQSTEARPKENSAGGVRHQYLDTVTQKDNLLSKIDAVDLEIAKRRQEIHMAELTYKTGEHRLNLVIVDHKTYGIFYEMNDHRVRNLKGAKEKISDFLADGDDPQTAAYARRGLEARRSQREREFEEIRSKLQSRIEELRDQITKEQEDATRLLEQLRAERSRLETELNGAQEELRKYTARERQVVNRISKGFLEVRDVQAETATCTIIERTVELPRCAVCGYTAHDPDEMYCPFCTGGSSGIGVQRLSAKPKKVTFGMNPESPMTKDDFIWNPLFRPDKPMKVLYAGDALISTRYSRQYITQTISRYGNTAVEEMGADVDLVVAGRLATQSVEAARELGVDLVYEFELFPFLRR